MPLTKRVPVSEIFRWWQLEDRSIETAAESIIQWMREVEKLGIPHFGEAAVRLTPFRDLLASHFEREDGILSELRTHFDAKSPEIAAIERQTERDHQHLLHDLDDVIGRLKQLEPPFDSWQSVMREFGLFIARLEQHEEQESESIEAMMPDS